jgi:hypothetical protein
VFDWYTRNRMHDPKVKIPYCSEHRCTCVLLSEITKLCSHCCGLGATFCCKSASPVSLARTQQLAPSAVGKVIAPASRGCSPCATMADDLHKVTTCYLQGEQKKTYKMIVKGEGRTRGKRGKKSTEVERKANLNSG